MSKSTKKYLNKPSTSTIIKKLIIIMSKIYDAYEDDKKVILNHPKMLEYLFGGPIIKRDNLIDAIKVTPDICVPIILSKNQAQEIELWFISALNSMEQYGKLFVNYYKIIKKYTAEKGSKINFNKQIPSTGLIISSNINKIMDILYKLNICYVIDWSFKNEDEYVNAALAKPYYFGMRIKIDFLGCIFIKTQEYLTNKMVLFAIIYDYNSKQFDKDDHLKQYYLRQMNIHLLRLNSKLDLVSEIKKFIRKIKKSKTYVLSNGLATPIGLDVGDELKLFYQNYDYNHTIYMKYYDKKKYDNIDIPDEPIDMDMYSDKPCDESVEINQDLFKKIIGSKYIFTH